MTNPTNSTPAETPCPRCPDCGESIVDLSALFGCPTCKGSGAVSTPRVGDCGKCGKPVCPVGINMPGMLHQEPGEYCQCLPSAEDLGFAAKKNLHLLDPEASTPEASALPVVAHVRFMAAQHNAGQGNIEHEEWFESCKPDQLGIDGSKAEAVTWHDSATTEIRSLRQQLAERNADAERGRFLIEHGRWHRSDEQTHLAVLVARESDLSCYAMRESAIDSAIAQSKGGEGCAQFQSSI